MDTDTNTNTKCQRCGSNRIVEANGQCRDLFWIKQMNAPSSNNSQSEYYEGYALGEFNLGCGGDVMSVTFCLDCGQMQGLWPLPPTPFEDPQRWEEYYSEEQYEKTPIRQRCIDRYGYWTPALEKWMFERGEL